MQTHVVAIPTRSPSAVANSCKTIFYPQPVVGSHGINVHLDDKPHGRPHALPPPTNAVLNTNLCVTKQDLGSCVGSMMSLTYLDAGGNGLKVLPPELSRCMALEHLDFSRGQVQFMGEELSRLTKLR